MKWTNNISRLEACLRSLSVCDKSGNETAPDSAFMQWTRGTIQVRKGKKTVFLIGNGASASMASHFAADLAKSAHIRTQVFTDLSLITAIANDLSYEDVFAEPLRRQMIKGDMLVAISSSGQSPNVISACRTAASCGGSVITLSAMKQNNLLRSHGNLNFYVPVNAYGVAETCHAAILHYWTDQLAEPID